MMDGVAKSEEERDREPEEWATLKTFPEEPEPDSEPEMLSLKPMEAKDRKEN